MVIVAGTGPEMQSPAKQQEQTVHWVVVLGDFGRSPRMQYHTLSISQGYHTTVHVIAYGGSQPIEQLRQAGNVHMQLVPEPPAILRKLPRLLLLVCKVLHQLLWLLWLMLFRLPSPKTILMQNPPAIPTMLICWLAAKWHKAAWIIDWHNYGYTILALCHHPRHWLVRLACAYEHAWGCKATHHFCVTAAMRDDLALNWGIPGAHVLHDRPPAWFARTPISTTHTLFRKLGPSLAQPQHNDFLTALQSEQAASAHASPKVQYAPVECTLVSERRPPQAQAVLRADRPAVVVSSTSWTPDEDFGILLDALVQYDVLSTNNPSLPRVLLLITGKGPQKEMYLARLRQLTLSKVAVRTLWLEASDYPLLLGAADVGVCLHASSSGLDLPMKVVDMFGAGLPVCALAYSCISELVEDQQTGLLFSDPRQLAAQLASLLHGFPAAPSTQLRHMQRAVAQTQQALRWDDNWAEVAGPLLGVVPATTGPKA